MFSASWKEIWHYTIRAWRDYAPLKEFDFADRVPISDIALKAVVAVVLLLFVGGLGMSIKRRQGLIIAGAAFISFVLYRNTTILNSYYMWYLPPFTALLFITAGYGLSELIAKGPQPGIALGVVLAFAYAVHLPFSMPLDKEVQEKIENNVRARTGASLAALMTNPDDTVVLEPLGFIGWRVLNRTVYDFPGLGSKVAVRAAKHLSWPRVSGLVDALQPTYAVLRPNEYRDLIRRYPGTADKYEVADRIQAEPGLTLHNMGYSYRLSDVDFRILRRISDFEQVVRP
jgi:hypothetical protein